MDIEALKALAQDVTGWGNCNRAWLDSSEDEPAAVVGHIDEDGNEYAVTTVDCDQYYATQDSIKLARFYAAANPNAILELIGRIEALEAKPHNAEVRGASRLAGEASSREAATSTAGVEGGEK